MPLNFTLHYDDRINDLDDKVGDVAETVVTGPMYFVPNIRPGARIPVQDALPRPLGLAMRAFEGYLDTDGRLKNEQGGETGIRLWANDPAWNLPRLQYRVLADLTDLFGNPVPWQDFYFDAPTVDIERNLAAEMPKPGQKFGRGRPGFGIAVGGIDLDEQGRLLLTREDGQDIGAVEIPDLTEAFDEVAAQSVAYALTFGRR